MSIQLLFDENLSPRLVPLLASLYPGSSHVHAAGLSSASDLDIWNFAAANGLTIVTKDRDFPGIQFGPGPSAEGHSNHSRYLLNAAGRSHASVSSDPH